MSLFREFPPKRGRERRASSPSSPPAPPKIEPGNPSITFEVIGEQLTVKANVPADLESADAFAHMLLFLQQGRYMGTISSAINSAAVKVGAPEAAAVISTVLAQHDIPEPRKSKPTPPPGKPLIPPRKCVAYNLRMYT